MLACDMPRDVCVDPADVGGKWIPQSCRPALPAIIAYNRKSQTCGGLSHVLACRGKKGPFLSQDITIGLLSPLLLSNLRLRPSWLWYLGHIGVGLGCSNSFSAAMANMCPLGKSPVPLIAIRQSHSSIF